MPSPGVLEWDVTRGRPNPLHLKLPERLRVALDAADLTGVGVSLAAGLARNTALRLGRGEVPRVDVCERIARALGVSPCMLAFGVDVPAPPEDGHLLCDGIGARLQQARGEMHKAALGVAAQTTGQSVANIETGRSMPSVAMVEQLARALRISPCWLAYGVGPQPLPPRPRRKPAAG